VLWIGLRDDDGMLAAIAGAVATALASLGFEPEARAFRAHVTLARLRAPQPVTLGAVVRPVAFEVDHVALFQSHLHPKGARYERLAALPLA
jgi:2'-5' RNA ligase